MPALMINFARSGGTLLNKCLASLPHVIMLSEVSKYGGGWGIEGENSYTTPYEQSLNWYGIKLSSKEFRDSIIELSNFCDNRGKHLVIRDWTFINYFTNSLYRNTPTFKLTIVEELKELNPKIFVFIRDAIDVWISCGLPKTDEFFKTYLKYVKEIIKLNAATFKFEDFCNNPGVELKNICYSTGLEYEDVTDHCASYTKVNGDTQYSAASRGAQQGKIRPLQRILIDSNKIREINSCEEMIESNTLLGYPPEY